MIGEKLIRNNCCVIVPTYNNGPVLIDVLAHLQDFADRVIVVNDGSTDDTTAILSEFKSFDVISYPQNKGKGHTLKLGFKRAREKGFDYAISIDSDGQHKVADIEIFLDEIERHPGALLIGSRNLTAENMPGKNTFANRFSNFWFNLETGQKLPDTQSGYRLYPLKAVHSIRTFSTRYEFELEILARLAWKGVPLRPVEISVYYPPEGERISHFRPLRDFFRISVLNTVLVLAALLIYRPILILRQLTWKNFVRFVDEKIVRTGESNLQKSKAIGFGIFMGIIPVWGYQMILAVLFAHLLKLNKAVVLLASNISIGPMIPVVVYLSYLFGGIFIDNPNQLVFDREAITLDTIGEHLLQYLVGSVLLAVLSGLSVGLISYLSLQIFRKEKRVN